jgi:hypothetical protein
MAISRERGPLEVPRGKEVSLCRWFLVFILILGMVRF